MVVPSFGVVYEATEKTTGAKYAIKMVNGTKWTEKENFKFVDEVAIMKDIVHPNVVRLHKVYQYQQRRYAMVMDLCTGILCFAGACNHCAHCFHA